MGISTSPFLTSFRQNQKVYWGSSKTITYPEEMWGKRFGETVAYVRKGKYYKKFRNGVE